MSSSERIEATLPEKAAELLGIVILILMWGFIIVTYPKLPEQVPTHFDGAGKPDSWGSKSASFILPVIGTFVFFQLSFIVRLKASMNGSKKVTVNDDEAYYRTIGWFIRWLKILVMSIFCWITFTTYTTAIGKSDGIGIAFLPITVAIILGVVTYYIVRLRKFKIVRP